MPAQDTTEVYDKMAHEYDDKIWLDELVSHIWYRRRQLMKHVHGDTLEVSCGTGRNVSYFDPEKTTSVTFMDSSRSMLEVAREKFTQKFPTYDHVQYVKGKAEDLASMAASSGQNSIPSMKHLDFVHTRTPSLLCKTLDRCSAKAAALFCSSTANLTIKL